MCHSSHFIVQGKVVAMDFTYHSIRELWEASLSTSAVACHVVNVLTKVVLNQEENMSEEEEMQEAPNVLIELLKEMHWLAGQWHESCLASFPHANASKRVNISRRMRLGYLSERYGTTFIYRRDGRRDRDSSLPWMYISFSVRIGNTSERIEESLIWDRCGGMKSLGGKPVSKRSLISLSLRICGVHGLVSSAL